MTDKRIQGNLSDGNDRTKKSLTC